MHEESVDTVDKPSIEPSTMQSDDNGVTTSLPFIVITAKVRTISRVREILSRAFGRVFSAQLLSCIVEPINVFTKAHVISELLTLIKSLFSVVLLKTLPQALNNISLIKEKP